MKLSILNKVFSIRNKDCSNDFKVFIKNNLLVWRNIHEMNIRIPDRNAENWFMNNLIKQIYKVRK